MPEFSVVIITAPPPGQSGESAGPTVKIDGREALLRSVELFLNRSNVKQVLLAFDNAQAEEAKRKFGNHLAFSGVKLAWTTNKWFDQIVAMAEKLVADTSHVIVHDAARPAVPFSDIDALMEAAEKHDAVALTTALQAPLLELDEGGGAVAAHLPSRYVQVLTPQVFSRAKFLEIAKTRKDVHPSQLKTVTGSALNVRVGGNGDAGMVKAMLGMLPKPKLKALSNPFEEAQW
ncbi:2-C-methyl-D-erythritol 4-phosphate cytidylyltransferase [Humisphaera borealis]|uniref:2-C-methyl-D-erythritol 4-phosphate cytidylyltransferase n=1 Tax=Humisphaera borealis TaxID=2807512 RepID=A0A7M2WRL5_9BACT|nr:2-C-methyl-D-erythritol 4-phosphate cytidylyltransferase [Humisphaera borealis]QOV87894.1 2-C-methyl-D-erythritol 4-phosphate cytidylyltransferase [Humisphaera borealis]